MRPGPVVFVATLLAVLAGCSSTPEHVRLAQEYFAANNAAAFENSAAQQDFFRRTQHPDFTGEICALGGATVESEPVYSTLRPDPDFEPDGAGPARGDTWVVAVEVTTRQDGVVVGRQIGSQHLVQLDDRMFGFAPCPR
ncbi:hypothetical protein GIY23_21455 [Allosaccharopolyspora coralli]|uniref:Nuclear transport factor 2 family protein n=1 Tax=Allosaccharopolyspora coralli TaxID=2665642 RepID=A0A5Q3QAZ8_9PSEU|nr:hypothetical protein [Allosaccharopolyspora coralli]QGK71738.1 hypothetical protein GIY23_21455 [Allosaccharopolyspora coralli]